MEKQTIVLIGYMGSGKTTLGPLLAKELGMPFFDLDTLISTETGMSIPNMFAEKGEVYFRKKETEILQAYLSFEQPHVLALGGGTPCYGNAMEIIKKSVTTTSVYLKLSPKTLSNRLFKKKENRPVINHLKTKDSLEDFVRKHLFERSYYYNQSDISVDCNIIRTKDLVDTIIERLS